MDSSVEELHLHKINRGGRILPTKKSKITVSAERKGTTWGATAFLEFGQQLHIEPSKRGFLFFISNGGEVCTTAEEAKNLERESNH